MASAQGSKVLGRENMRTDFFAFLHFLFSRKIGCQYNFAVFCTLIHFVFSLHSAVATSVSYFVAKTGGHFEGCFIFTCKTVGIVRSGCNHFSILPTSPLRVAYWGSLQSGPLLSLLFPLFCCRKRLALTTLKTGDPACVFCTHPHGGPGTGT